MSLILLVDSKAPTEGPLVAVLESQGWAVAQAGSRDEALAFYSSQSPDLVLVEEQLAGAGELVAVFSRRSGGPGVVLMRHKSLESDLPQEFHRVDAMVRQGGPIQELVETVRQRLALDPQHRSMAAPAGGKRIYTASEIFGDLLREISDPVEKGTELSAAEVDSESGTGAAPDWLPAGEEVLVDPSPPAAEELARPAPEPAETAAPTATAGLRARTEDPGIEAQVDGLLAGVLAESRTGLGRSVPARPEIRVASPRVDALLAWALKGGQPPVELAVERTGVAPAPAHAAEPSALQGPEDRPGGGAVEKVVSLWRSWRTRVESPVAASENQEDDTEVVLRDLFGGDDGAEQ